MPLTFVEIGQTVEIIMIKGREKVKSFLESLGFVSGSDITVVSHLSGDIIVNVKGTKVAISRDMANKIMVKEIS